MVEGGRESKVFDCPDWAATQVAGNVTGLGSESFGISLYSVTLDRYFCICVYFLVLCISNVFDSDMPWICVFFCHLPAGVYALDVYLCICEFVYLCICVFVYLYISNVFNCPDRASGWECDRPWL